MVLAVDLTLAPLEELDVGLAERSEADSVASVGVRDMSLLSFLGGLSSNTSSETEKGSSEGVSAEHAHQHEDVDRAFFGASATPGES